MTPRFWMIALLSSLLLVCLAPSSWAVQWAEPPLLDWEQEALTVFDRNDYDGVIELVNAQRNDPNHNGHLLLYFAHAQKYYLERDRNSALYYKQHYATTENRMQAANLPVLTRLVAMPQLEWNKKVNKRFLDKAFENAQGEEYLGALLYYLDQGSPDVSNAAIGGLSKILAAKRAIVMNGGSLSSADRSWISDPKMIKLLVKRAGENASPVAGFMAKLPAMARKHAMGGAPACLALVEEPALPFLQEAAAMGNANAAATITLVKDARGERLGKHPNSTWYSATGK